MMISDWEQSVDVSNKLLLKDSDNINANLMLLVNHLAR